MVNVTAPLSAAGKGGRPMLYGVKWMKIPKALRPNVTQLQERKGQATCTEEMSTLLNCWTKHQFNDKECPAQIQAFMQCSSQSWKDLKSGVNKPKFSHQEVNDLLRQNTDVRKAKPQTPWHRQLHNKLNCEFHNYPNTLPHLDSAELPGTAKPKHHNNRNI